MIIGDKISALRKKNGWSQEELAEKMNVSRQAVSKWESSQSVPDLERVLKLGTLFGVTTDFLLKDDIEETEHLTTPEALTRSVTMEEANEYLALREIAAKRIAMGTFLCIISPICLLILAAFTELTTLKISENFAAGAGLIVLLALVAVAVMMFVSCGNMSAPYAYLENEPFETEYGVVGMVKERQKAFRTTYARYNSVGICICILSPIPLFIGVFMGNNLLVMIFLCIMIALIGIAVVFFIMAGVKLESMKKLLQEGEYTFNAKSKKPIRDKVASVYWLIATAIYLGWSFYTNAWHMTWIIWPVAGVIFAIVMIICNFIEE